LNYKHFDNEKYTTKNYEEDEDLDDKILEDFEIEE